VEGEQVVRVWKELLTYGKCLAVTANLILTANMDLIFGSLPSNGAGRGRVVRSGPSYFSVFTLIS